MPKTGQSWGSNFDKLADHVWEMMRELQSSKVFHAQSSPEWCPHLNLYETDNAFLVCVELSGIDRDKIDVRSETGTLSVSGFRDKPVLPDMKSDVSVHLMEIDSGRFHRKVAIPMDVNVDAIQATYKHGYLWIVLPRRNKQVSGGAP